MCTAAHVAGFQESTSKGDPLKIEVLWNKPDGTKPVVGFDTNPQDPYRDDVEMQVMKSRAAAQVYFRQQFDESPEPAHLVHRVIK